MALRRENRSRGVGGIKWSAASVRTTWHPDSIEQTRTVRSHSSSDDPRAFAVIREGTGRRVDGRKRENRRPDNAVSRHVLSASDSNFDPDRRTRRAASGKHSNGQPCLAIPTRSQRIGQKSIRTLVKKTDEEKIAAKENDAAKQTTQPTRTPAGQRKK